MTDLARISVAIGRTALVRDLADQVWPDVARRRHGALAARAVLAEAEGRLDAAASLYDQAAEQWSTYGHRPERGHALLAAGRCLAEVGRPGAHERLAEARAVFADLGARPLLALADGRLAEVERSG